MNRKITATQLRQAAMAASVAISLALLLVYTWWHTGGLMARYVAPPWLGYVAAAGIEIAIVALSLRIRDLRHARQDVALYIGALLAVVVVSAGANMAEGYQTRYSVALTVDNLNGIDPIQATIGVLATGLISLLVFALAEIIGQDIGDRQPLAAATEATIDAPAAVVTPELTSDQARLVAFYRDNATATQAEAAVHVGKSRQWVGGTLRDLEAAGVVVSRNGSGVEVRHGG
jgi:hypothetical protein